MNQFTFHLLTSIRKEETCTTWVIRHNTNLFPDRIDTNSGYLLRNGCALSLWHELHILQKCNLISHRTHNNFWQDFIPDAMLKFKLKYTCEHLVKNNQISSCFMLEMIVISKFLIRIYRAPQQHPANDMCREIFICTCFMIPPTSIWKDATGWKLEMTISSQENDWQLVFQ